MILEEEKLVLHWLSLYRVMTYEQLILLIKNRPRQTAERIIRGLRKQQRIHSISGGYYLGLSPVLKPEPMRIEALWVLLQYADRIDPMNHRPGSYPSQIYFLKDNTGYDIVVLQEGEYMLPTMLRPSKNMKYIFVVPDESMIPEVKTPDAPCLFAVVKQSGSDTPNVHFYVQEDMSDGSE